MLRTPSLNALSSISVISDCPASRMDSMESIQDIGSSIFTSRTIQLSAFFEGIPRTRTSMYPSLSSTPQTSSIRENFKNKSSRVIFRSPVLTESKPKTSKLSEYEILGDIGRGTFSQVKKAVHVKTKKKFALKAYDLRKIRSVRDRENIQNEIRALQRTSHSSIVQLFDVFTIPGKIVLVLEYLKGLTLLSYVMRKPSQKLTVKEAKFYFAKVVNAVQYLHANKIAHKDINPSNIIISKKTLKLIDFKNSSFNNRLCRDSYGQARFVPPEVTTNKSYDGSKADIWQCGALLSFMLAEQNIPDLVRNMLEKNPSSRPSASEIITHPWVYENKKIQKDRTDVLNLSIISSCSAGID